MPPAWIWLVDEAIPSLVKNRYSPRESWKDKPFSQDDARFFFKGVEELSELFTEERPKNLPAYFSHPRFRSSYLLYFLPLQAAKFLTLYGLHADALKAALDHGRRSGELRILDLGAGPGTASIALLLHCLTLPASEIPAKLRLDWYDLNKTILGDGQKLVETLADSFPKLRGRVEVRVHAEPWTRAASAGGETSLILLGHVLNESGAQDSEVLALERLLGRARGGGLLAVEPAARRPSQTLSGLRDRLLASPERSGKAEAIWGPCLHAGNCPLSEGRDWCHFSVNTDIPGKWFAMLSKGLGSERHWLKFSYLWLSSSDAPSRPAPRDLRLVVSDPIAKPGSREATLLVCEPEQPGRLRISAKSTIHRGDTVDLRRM